MTNEDRESKGFNLFNVYINIEQNNMHGRGFTECSELTHTETEDEVAPVIPLGFWAAGIPPGQDTWVEQQ